MAKLEGISHSYALPNGSRKTVLNDIDLDLQPGGFYVILGRSGCGKSTLLRILAGLEQPEQGALCMSTDQVGVVFQEARLMPWLSVQANVSFLIQERLPAPEVQTRTHAMLETVGLSQVKDAWPNQLSGGMAQRVSIARALVAHPNLLLMDEPFSALDAFTRKQMQDELVQLWQRTGTTIVFVTHDIEEAVRLAQHVLVLENGSFALHFDITAPYPRSGAEPAVNHARQCLLHQLFSVPTAPQTL